MTRLENAADKRRIDQAAQWLWDWERTRPYGELLPVALADASTAARESMMADARFVVLNEHTADMAREMAVARGLDWDNVIEKAREFWHHRVKIALMQLVIEPPRHVTAEERTASLLRGEVGQPKPDPGMGVCRKCQGPMLWAKHYDSGKWMAIDPSPQVGIGGILIDEEGTAYPFPNYEAAVGAVDRAPKLLKHVGMIVHQAVCPAAAQERAARAEAQRQAELERVGGEQISMEEMW